MGKRNTEIRSKAIDLHKQGSSRKHIAEQLGISPDSVKTWIAMYKNGQEDLTTDRPHHKTYSLELKLDAVLAHIRDGRTLAEVTVSYGISNPSLLKHWCKEYRETGNISSSGPGRRPRKSQSDDPVARIRELEMQVDILKKALELQRRG